MRNQVSIPYICACTLGWPLSPEATTQQILCTVPTNDTITLRSNYFFDHDKIKMIMTKYPNATIETPTRNGKTS